MLNGAEVYTYVSDNSQFEYSLSFHFFGTDNLTPVQMRKRKMKLHCLNSLLGICNRTN